MGKKGKSVGRRRKGRGGEGKGGRGRGRRKRERERGREREWEGESGREEATHRLLSPHSTSLPPTQNGPGSDHHDNNHQVSSHFLRGQLQTNCPTTITAQPQVITTISQPAMGNSPTSQVVVPFPVPQLNMEWARHAPEFPAGNPFT